MRQRWSRPIPALDVDVADVQRVVDDALPGASVLAVTPIEGGLANTNMKVSLDRAPRNVLLRLYQRDPRQAEKERTIAKRLRSVVPIPQFLFLGDIGGHRCALLEWVEGERLEIALDGASQQSIAAFGERAGQMLAKVHALTFDQSGFLDGNLNRSPSAWIFSWATFAALSSRAAALGSSAKSLPMPQSPM